MTYRTVNFGDSSDLFIKCQSRVVVAVGIIFIPHFSNVRKHNRINSWNSNYENIYENYAHQKNCWFYLEYCRRHQTLRKRLRMSRMFDLIIDKNYDQFKNE